MMKNPTQSMYLRVPSCHPAIHMSTQRKQDGQEDLDAWYKKSEPKMTIEQLNGIIEGVAFKMDKHFADVNMYLLDLNRRLEKIEEARPPGTRAKPVNHTTPLFNEPPP